MSVATRNPSVAVIGAGPAGLMAAEAALAAGARVTVFDVMPSPARKLLLAGRGGLNLTHSEPFAAFLARYGARADRLAPHLVAFGPDQLRLWAADLGIATFIGSSGRVFPTDFKAAPLVRAWLRRLKAAGMTLHVRHRWLGWTAEGALRFATAEGEARPHPAATVLALGGASWPHLGSDGGWVTALEAAGLSLAPLRPANCGFLVPWSPWFRAHLAGQPLKPAVLTFDGHSVKGELMLTETGIEGGAVYALAAELRDAIARAGSARLLLDLKPDWSVERLTQALTRPRGSRSLSTHLARAIGLTGPAAALAREVLTPDTLAEASPPALAAALKTLPLMLTAPAPLERAISTAGGVRFEALTSDLMAQARPGLFVAGEMLDWEAPTGGYLLTACLATGRAAGQAAALWASRARPCSPAP